jgi:inositol transport system substrate-binding protein
MKKSLVAVLLFVIASSLAFMGCQRTPSDQYRVAFIARAQGDAFAAWLANSMMAEAELYPNIALSVFDGQAMDHIVNNHIENAIVNRFDLIILQSNNGEAQYPFIRQVVNAGIPIILTNPRVPGLEYITHSVDADPFEQGAVNARLAVTQIPQNAQVVVLNGPAGNMHSTERRRAWQQEFFNLRPDVQIVGEQIANWNKDEAMLHMEDWVTALDRIDAVISMNDNMAAGAIEAVAGMAAFDNLLVYGVDGTAEAALLIMDGRLTSTSFQNAYELARTSMELANRILTGEVTGFVNVDIDCPLITIDNVSLLFDAHRAAGAL